eukprot:jgi/Botrbrau1/5093/Bobra.0128s0004.1
MQYDDAESLKLSGSAKCALGMHHEALLDLDKADRLQPHDAFTLQMHGPVQWKRGRLDAALRDLEAALELRGGEDGDVLAFRAAVRLERGDRLGAREDAERALRALSALPASANYLPETPCICQDVLRHCQGEK